MALRRVAALGSRAAGAARTGAARAASTTSAAASQATLHGAGDGGAPEDALAVPAEAGGGGGGVPEVAEDAPGPMFDRTFTKEELQKIRENIPLQREPLYQPPALTRKEQLFYPLFRALGAHSVEEQATQNAWFDALGLPRTWMTEHALLTMHVWILHRRHMLDFYAEGEFNGRQADSLLFDEFWKDSEWRIRSAKNADVSFNRQQELVQKGSFMDMFELDAGLGVPDDDNMELAGALYRGVFQSRPGVDARLPLLLADWLRAEVWNVLTQPAEDVYRGWITWSPALGESAPARLQRQREHFQGEWREHTWIDGSVYFYNTVTHQRSDDVAEVPLEGFYGKRRWALVAHLREREAAGSLPEAWAGELARLTAQEAAREAAVGAPGDPVAAAAELAAGAADAERSRSRSALEAGPAATAFPPPAAAAAAAEGAGEDYPRSGR